MKLTRVIFAGITASGLHSYGGEEFGYSYTSQSPSFSAELQDPVIAVGYHDIMTNQKTFGDTGSGYFSFGANVTGTYDSNVFLSNSNEESDFILSAALPIEWASGAEDQAQRLALSYTPAYNLYFDNDDQNNLSHDLNLSMLNTFDKTQFNTDVYARHFQGADRFASGQVERLEYGGGISTNYDFTDKSDLILDIGARFTEFEEGSLFDTEAYNARLSWLYEVASKTKLGVYLGGQRVEVQSNPSHTALSAGLRGDYSLSEKTNVIGFAGVEHRSFSGDGESQVNPEFEIGLQHELTAKTSILATAYRKVTESYVDSDLAYNATGASVSVRHQASDRLVGNVTYTYENNDFFSTNDQSFVDRDSNFSTISVGAEYELYENLVATGGVSYRVNESDLSSRDSENFLVRGGFNFKF